MPFLEYSSFLVIGVFAGLLAGLLGIGGGVVVVPSLFFVFHLLGFFPHNMQLAVGTSLAAMITTSFASTYRCHKKNTILWDYVLNLSPGLVIGCILGAISAYFLYSDLLAFIFAIFAMLFGSYLLFPQFPQLHLGKPKKIKLQICGSLVGFSSSLLGIGGGTVAIPILNGFKIAHKNASAISSTCTFLTSFVGTIVYLFDNSTPVGVHYSFGSIYIPAFILISIGSLLSVNLGVHLAHTLPTALIKKIFALLLIATGISMIILLYV